jgi:GT2 family glycosyltransferase
VLSAGGQEIARRSFAPDERTAFVPRGRIERASPVDLRGWVFHPALWLQGLDPPAVELRVDDKILLPLPLNERRDDLGFSGLSEVDIAGFRLLPSDIKRILSRSGQGQALVKNASRMELLVGGSPVVGASPAKSRKPKAASDPAGFVDFYGHVQDFGGYLLAGWMSGTEPDRAQSGWCMLRFASGERSGEALLAWHPRSDVEGFGWGFGWGFVCFLPGERVDAAFVDMEIEVSGRRLLYPSNGVRELDQSALVPNCIDLLKARPDGLLHAMLRQPLFNGKDTLAELAAHVQLAIDEFILVPGDGALLTGWVIDPTFAVRSIRLRAHGFQSQDMTSAWVSQPRPDLVAAFQSLGLADHARPGFTAFVPLNAQRLIAPHLEVTLHSGEVGFKSLPSARGGSLNAILSMLNGVEVAPDDMARSFAGVFAPATRALNRARLSQRAPHLLVNIGPEVVGPAVSVIVPLYGRIDWMLHQCAHFSRHGLPGVELIYVLDDPPRKNDMISLAQRCFRWFGIPMRLVLLPQNVGYGPANNEALRVARGRHVCFLNSDVLPRDGEWLRRMVGALEADDDLGAVGARLLFEDGTLQHDGMSLRRLPQFGNIPFPLHPGKGQRPPPGQGLRKVEAITGACMVLPRALAQELGGFDEDYAVGDFEDVDFCLRIRAKGLTCAVHDEVVMWHLERQSQQAPGVSWRQNLTTVNAWTFSERWGHAVVGAPCPPGAVLNLS